MPNGVQHRVRLENCLILLAWLNSLLGYENNETMLKDCVEVQEGYYADGQSYLCQHLLARGRKVRIPADDLIRYDENIRCHLEKMNRHRSIPITLRYFQHLAALYTEVFLDRFFNHKDLLIEDLSAFVEERNTQPGEPQLDPIVREDLTKLAYWMATGSGKTLLMHLNYYQFLHYNRDPLDNILLITPNKELSDQHIDELLLSGIHARRFDLNNNDSSNVVQVLEITKLVGEKTGAGISVPVESFEGKNLIFVDEGHKGTGGQAWRRYRDALAETGFTFEYSATFGQALSAVGNDSLTTEYGKTILFDYSYRYFYGDGFGKDFRILNLRDVNYNNQTDILLLGNLLSFYEQLRLYEDRYPALRPYNLEKPLWVFVGRTVKNSISRVTIGESEVSSDVLTVVRFLHRIFSDCNWVTATIDNILNGRTQLRNQNGWDVFSNHFPYLREKNQNGVALYNDILRKVFHSSQSGSLHLADIRGSQGEIGLKASNADQYFGVIYIGDTSAFKNLVEEHANGITLEEDVIRDSLFDDINQPDSKIHVLVGAKKFMEGWNSWRVSNMGLLNIGSMEGSQIIQLFGRGVRLKGAQMSLKRSAVLEGPHPKHINILETLNIFSVKANYVAQFREYLEREGVETEPLIELPLFTWINEPALKKSLVIPRAPNGQSFASDERFDLKADKNIVVRLDMSIKLQAMAGAGYGLNQDNVQAGQKLRIPHESLNLVNWERVYLDLLEYKYSKEWHNLTIQPKTPPKLMETINYELITDEEVVNPSSFSGRILLQQAITSILKKYLDAYYHRRRERWETEVMEYRLLDNNDPNIAINVDRVSENKACYIVRSSDAQLIAAVNNLLNNRDRLYKEEDQDLQRINFCGSLYLPILIEQTNRKLQTIPPVLNSSETQFLRDLKTFRDEEGNNFLAGKELFVLRNLSRGKGVGFFENSGFYPDFILWVLANNKQRIVFIEPHGMMHAKAYIHDEKARLWERLIKLANEISNRSGRNDVSLDSYIISATTYPDLYMTYDNGTWCKEKFAEKHILFPERDQNYDYMHFLFGK
ncbi:DEAD/DEAH box helicase family protein [Mesotoga prima]|uniref:DEAD/DEAH box helicase family protein n=1 Tax=Mesotoga prima TaxID=1184387 RepID=UPI002D0F4B9F|nr:DEAD/DEAH box helicase family protein [Mesotoga prima]HQC14827.1 DEAD/DEAH box helicase family protein [Mesotoga prima]